MRHRRGLQARWLAVLFVLALLPTVELVEQGAHAVEHVLVGEPAGHDAHHDGHDPADEHGCTQLVHVCGAHHGFGLTPALPAPLLARFEIAALAARSPQDLHDLAAREPQHRPPIA